MGWFYELPVFLRVLIVTVGLLVGGGYISFSVIRAIAQGSVNRDLEKLGLLSTGITNFYVSRQVYKIHVDNCIADHPLGDSLFHYQFCAEPDGHILLRVCGGMDVSDYPPSWPDHKLRCVIDIFGSTGVYAPNGKSDNIASVFERELILVSDSEYKGYLKARNTKA